MTVDDRTPQPWPGYRILAPLRADGAPGVYRAQDLRLGREVALKVLPAAAAGDARARQRFLAEARALARVSHPNVVSVHDVLEQDEHCAFVMELVPGASLQALLEAAAAAPQAERMTAALRALGVAEPTEHGGSWVRFVAHLGRQIGEALGAVHAAGLVHRDVKPGNLQIRPDGSAVLVDFGVVRTPDAAFRTVTGEFVGTLAYAAPEQLRAHDAALDARADVYALGATLYHALTMRAPFADGSPSRVVDRIEAGALRAAHQVDRSVPRDLGWVVARAMEPDPARRYPSALELAADLGHVLALRPVAAQPFGAWRRLTRTRARHPVAFASGLAACLTAMLAGSVALTDLEVRHGRSRQALDRLLEQGLLAEVEELAAVGVGPTAALERWLRQAEQLLARYGDTPAAPSPEALRERDRAAGARRELDSARPPVNAELLGQWVRAVEARAARLSLRQAHAFLTRRLADARAAAQQYQASLATLWAGTLQAIAVRHPTLPRVPQLGLVPLGPDPVSGLLEFAHLPSGRVPMRDAATGRLLVDQDCGVVLVLVPGGATQVGARRPGPGEADGVEFRDAYQDTGVDRVTLTPFLIARTEMTQAQWQRVTGSNPSWFAAGAQVGSTLVTAEHPVESVLHETARAVLARLDLDLPTQAQWEHAARGGTDTRYWTGPDADSLEGAENLQDASYWQRLSGSDPAARRGDPSPWDDQFPIHAPVARLRANGFGLFDMLGNVAEWTRELGVMTRHRVAPVDGDGHFDRSSPGSWQPISRGGAWDLGRFVARVSFVLGRPPGVRFAGVGVRPARAWRDR